jgi:hypothetical protein
MQVRWTVLLRAPYSPYLAPPDLHLFGLLRDAVWGRRFADDSELKHNVRAELQRFSKDFCATSIERLTQSWKKCVSNEGHFVEK